MVRTAGNVVGDFELGSIEYAVEHLGVPLILVMGHSQCGAVLAALEGHADGYIEDVLREIREGLHAKTDVDAAICDNIRHSYQGVLCSAVVRELIRAGRVEVVCARYDIATGKVSLLQCERAERV